MGKNSPHFLHPQRNLRCGLYTHDNPHPPRGDPSKPCTIVPCKQQAGSLTVEFKHKTPKHVTKEHINNCNIKALHFKTNMVQSRIGREVYSRLLTWGRSQRSSELSPSDTAGGRDISAGRAGAKQRGERVLLHRTLSYSCVQDCDEAPLKLVPPLSQKLGDRAPPSLRTTFQRDGFQVLEKNIPGL